MAILRSLIVSLLARTEHFDQGMRRAEGSLRGFRTATVQFQGQMRGLSTELLKFSAAQAGIASALDATRKLFQTGLNLERIQQNLVSSTGSVAGMQRAMLLLQATVRETGFSLQVLSQGLSAVQDASRNTTLAGEDAVRIWLLFSRAGAAAGLSAEQMGTVYQELTEILNQQTMTTRDLMPLLKAFPGILDAAATAMGVTREEFERMGKAGELLTTVVLPRLAEELGTTTTQNVMPLTKAVSELRTAWDELWQTLAQSGVLEVVTRQIKDLVSFLKSNEGFLEKWSKTLLAGLAGLAKVPKLGPLGDLLTPGTAEAPGTGGLAPGQPRPGAVVPPPDVSTTAPPMVDTSRAREIQRLEKDLRAKHQEARTILEEAQHQAARSPLQADEILRPALEAVDTIVKAIDLLEKNLADSRRDLANQGQKLQDQAAAVRSAPGPSSRAGAPGEGDVVRRIREEAIRQGVDPQLAVAVARQESGLNPRAVGDRGRSLGLFQLQAAAAIDAGIDPRRRGEMEENIRGGVTYLRQKLAQSGGNVEQALSRYNRGTPTYRGIGDPNYVANVLRYMGPSAAAAPVPALTPAPVPATPAVAMAAAAPSAETAALKRDIALQKASLDARLARLALEDRYIDLIIDESAAMDALVLSEDDLKLTSLERLQAQMTTTKALQELMRRDPVGGATALQEYFASLQAERQGMERDAAIMETMTDLRRQQQQSVDGLVGGLEDQVRVLTLTNRQYLEYQLNLQNATDAERGQALALADKVHMLEVSRQAADTVTDALIDMAVTGEINLKNLQDTFSRMVLSMLADALKIRETLTKLFAKGIETAINLLPSGPGGGTATAAEASAAVEGFRGIYGGGLQHGGAVVPGRFYTVGEAGPELLVAGSAGTVLPGGGRPVVINMTVNTPDADSFRRSGNQIAAQMVGAAQRARRVM